MIRRAGFLMLAAIGVGVVAVMAVVKGVWSTPISNKERVFRDTRGIFSSLSMQEFVDESQLRSALSVMQVIDSAGVNERQRSQLTRALAELIAMYCINDNPDAYRSWRESRGDQFVSARLRPGWSMEEILGSLRLFSDDPQSVESAAAADDWWTLYVMAWHQSRAVGNGANRFHAIATDPSSLIAEIIELGPDERFPRLERGIGSTAWHGASSMASRPWFVPRLSLADVQRRDGRALVAVAGVVLEGADAIRRPIIVHLYWDQQSGFWRIERVIQSNVPEKHLTWPWEL